MSNVLQVQMLGGMSLTLGDRSIDDNSNRMKKVWLLLAYLIHTRNSRATQEGCLALFQGGEDSADPNGRLKTMLYRVRNMLNGLEDGAGHGWIVRRDGAYGWNPQVEVQLDAELFERLCAQAGEAEDPQAACALYGQAMALYKGDFLPKLAMEPWVMPLSTYYHRVYLEAVQKYLELLEETAQWDVAAQVCETALRMEPYSEELYQHLMLCRISQGNRNAALQIYEQMSEMLFSNFGVMPSEGSRELYRQAGSSAQSQAVAAGGLRERLKETDGAKGALYCEYEFFRMLYQLQARAIVRSGEVIHIALFSIRGQGGKELSQRSLSTAMDNFQQLLIDNLRQGDVVTRCSVSQLIIMLPQANYENSCAVCQRLLQAFGRQYPHSPVSIHYSVQPLEPRNRGEN